MANWPSWFVSALSSPILTVTPTRGGRPAGETMPLTLPSWVEVSPGPVPSSLLEQAANMKSINRRLKLEIHLFLIRSSFLRSGLWPPIPSGSVGACRRGIAAP